MIAIYVSGTYTHDGKRKHTTITGKSKFDLTALKSSSFVLKANDRAVFVYRVCWKSMQEEELSKTFPESLNLKVSDTDILMN
jgi:hypothetical protein